MVYLIRTLTGPPCFFRSVSGVIPALCEATLESANGPQSQHGKHTFQCLGIPGKSGSGGRFGPGSRESRYSGAENPRHPVFFSCSASASLAPPGAPGPIPQFHPCRPRPLPEAGNSLQRGANTCGPTAQHQPALFPSLRHTDHLAVVVLVESTRRLALPTRPQSHWSRVQGDSGPLPLLPS